jgi:hypothetical protein
MNQSQQSLKTRMINRIGGFSLFLIFILFASGTAGYSNNDSSISFELYDSPHPQNYIPELQKGLLMHRDGQSVVGGGMGVGVPVVNIEDKWYYSKTSRLLDAPTNYERMKVFYFDCYREEWEGQVRYVDVDPPVGSVTVTYTILDDRVRVFFDMGGLTASYDRMLALNEMDGRVFPIYRGSSLDTIRNRNFHWVEVNNGCGSFYSDDVAYFMSADSNLSWGIGCRSQAKLVRSRRVDGNRANFSGLQFEIMGGLSSFYYVLIYETPQNTAVWWEDLESHVPLTKF